MAFRACLERRFDQLGHRLTLPSRFPPETAHDGIVNVKRSLHMENHIHDMAIWQICLRAVFVGIRSGQIGGWETAARCCFLLAFSF